MSLGFSVADQKISLATVAKVKRKYPKRNPESISIQYFVSPSQLVCVSTEILIDLEEAIDSYDVSQDKGLTKPGMYVWNKNTVSQVTSRTHEFR